MLRPEVSGRIARIGFRDGQRVKRGQLLVQLDDTLQRAQLQQSQAQASIARTNLQRNRELLAQNFVSASAVDQSAAALEVAEAQVALSQAQLARMRIESPFDGVAGIAQRRTWATTSRTAPTWSTSRTRRRCRWTSACPSVTSPGSSPASRWTCSSMRLPGRSFTGAHRAHRFADRRQRPLAAGARAAAPTRRACCAPACSRARASCSRCASNALVVPEEALVPQGGKQYLIKVVDGPGGKVSQRLEARIGMRLPGKVEITRRPGGRRHGRHRRAGPAAARRGGAAAAWSTVGPRGAARLPARRPSACGR